MQKYFQFVEKDTKAQRNRIICQVLQKKSQYMKQADSRSVLNTNIHDLFQPQVRAPSLIYPPDTPQQSHQLSEHLSRSKDLCECCRAHRHVTSSAATGTISLYSVLQHNTSLQRSTSQSREFSKNPGIDFNHGSGNSGQVTGYQVLTCLQHIINHFSVEQEMRKVRQQMLHVWAED